jgi:hypothetical protein
MLINFTIPKISNELACAIRNKMNSKQINNWAIVDITTYTKDWFVTVVDIDMKDEYCITVDKSFYNGEREIVGKEVL